MCKDANDSKSIGEGDMLKLVPQCIVGAEKGLTEGSRCRLTSRQHPNGLELGNDELM